MLTSFFNSLLRGADSSFPTDQSKKCEVKACLFFRSDGLSVCPYHAHFFDYSCSLTSRYIPAEDIYRYKEDWFSYRLWPTLSIAPSREVFWRPNIRVVMNGQIQKPRDPYKDKDWGAIEAARRFLFADRDARPAPGKPNRLTTSEVIHPDGCVTKTLLPFSREGLSANRQQTGAFVLWKGYGKSKIRKKQRNRPAGWHGNHPEQKPRDRWGSREALSDIPQWTRPVKETIRAESANGDDTEGQEKDAAIASMECDFEQLFGSGSESEHHAKAAGA